MAEFKVRVTQVFRVERSIVVTVEADNLAQALDQQGDADAPAFGDPGWEANWDLQNEEVNDAAV